MLVTGALLAAFVSACGNPAHLYSLQKTTACLKTKPVRLGGPLDFVATTAPGGAVKVHTGANFVTVVFGKTVDDATNIDDAYRRFAARNVGVEDVLQQNENAVMLWHAHPDQSQVDLINGCLK
jgi:hypothetical protein